jgi:type II secretory pathway component GspD/PulD (secretin)
MKSMALSLPLLALVIAAGCDKQQPDPKSALRVTVARTFSSFDPPTPGEKVMAANLIKFEQAELAQVLKIYGEISGRSIIRAPNLPDIKVTFSNQTPMTAVEALQALDTVLAAQGVTMVFLGTHYVKAVSATEAHLEPGPIVELKPEQLPDSSSFLIYIVKLKDGKGSQAPHALQPFAKFPNSIIMIGGSLPPSKSGLPNLPASLFGSKDDLLVLRDYSSNVRRMLQVLEKMEER